LQEINDLDTTLRAFVAQAFADLSNSAPELLNQLSELAAALGNDPNYATTILDKFATLIGNVPTVLNSLAKIAAAINNDPNYATNIATTIGNLDNTLRAKIASLISDVVQPSVPDAAFVFPDELGQIIAALWSDAFSLPGMSYNRPGTPSGWSVGDGLYEDIAVRDGRVFLPGLNIRATSTGFHLRNTDGAPLITKESSVSGTQFGNDLYVYEAHDENGVPTLPRSTITTPLFGSQIFMVSDRKLPLYARSIARFHDDGVLPIVSFDCARAAPLQSYCDVTQDTMRIDPTLSGTGLLTLRNPGDRQKRGTKSVTIASVSVPFAAPATVKVLALGDSITHRGLTYDSDAFLKAWNITPTWLGTLRGTIPSGASTGPLCEGREGWSSNDYLGVSMDPTIVTLGPLPAGQEAAYLAGSDGLRTTYNPFLNANTASGAQTPVVTIGSTNYRFDLRFYLTRFSIADPDIVLLNLGMNDSNRLGALPNGNTSALIAEIRRVLPNARIVVWGTAPAVSRDGDSLWLKHIATLDAICATVSSMRAAGDTKLHLVSAWAHMSLESGFALSNSGSMDSAGNVTTVISDPVHPIDVAARQIHECVAAAIANLI
jgi:lysophospholipase L1-like esterase